MPFKLPNAPSPKAHVHELADFAELLAWTSGRCSATDVQRYLIQIDDNQDNVGIDDDDVEIENLSDEMMMEIDRRREACGGGYPFNLDPTGSVLTPLSDDRESHAVVYLYLLMATRLNMKSEKVKGEIDGTVLLESLSSEVLGNYLGRDRACVQIFGTAVGGKFPDKVNDLCKAIGEGGRFEHIDSGKVNANDGSLDVVGWIPFSDGLPSKLSIFGQCKTGTSWRSHMSDLRPDNFIKHWMSGFFVFEPLRAFFIAESADRAHWSGNALYTGLLFDRCRIVDFSNGIEPALLASIRQWTEAARSELVASSWGV